jgi:hypothetical protein
LGRNSRESTRARWVRNAAKRTQPIVLDVRLTAQGKPAVAAFFREHGFSSDYFPRIASRSSRIRCRKKYHNQGREHSSEIAMPEIWGQLAPRKTSRSACGQLSLNTRVTIRSRQFDGITCHFSRKNARQRGKGPLLLRFCFRCGDTRPLKLPNPAL